MTVLEFKQQYTEIKDMYLIVISPKGRLIRENKNYYNSYLIEASGFDLDDKFYLQIRRVKRLKSGGKKMKVKFVDIGRSKATFIKEIELSDGKLVYESMYSAVKPYLYSSEIDFIINSPTGGSVVVGGVRPVGTWEIVEDEESKL